MASSSLTSLWRDNQIKAGSIATVLTLLGCIGTHLLTAFGLVGAFLWLAEVEHALLAALAISAAFTAYAIWRHRRGDCCQSHPPAKE